MRQTRSAQSMLSDADVPFTFIDAEEQTTHGFSIRSHRRRTYSTGSSGRRDTIQGGRACQKSHQINIISPKTSECPMDLPAKLRAKQSQWITGETDISCEVCNVFLFNNLHIGEEEIIDTDADANDMEDDYVDDVTVTEAEIDINTTPYEGRAKRAMEGLDVIKNRLRLEDSLVIKNFRGIVHYPFQTYR